MKRLQVLEHPLVNHYLTVMRNSKSSSKEYRDALEILSSFLAFEMTRDLRVKKVEIQGHMGKLWCNQVAEESILISVYRAGEGMLPSFQNLIPKSRVGHIGLHHDRLEKRTAEYFHKFPKNMAGQRCIVVDPVIATANTISSIIARLKEYEVGPLQLAIIACSKEGIERLHKEHPDLSITCCAIDDKLDSQGFLDPGVGDPADQMYENL